MVFVQPSAADQILGPLENFGKNLDRFLRPNREFQLAMQKAISVNPGLAVQLSGLEKNAPGTLQAMGFGDLGKIISQIPEDVTNQFARENRGEIFATDKGKLDVQNAEQGVTLDRINRTIQLLKDNPNVGRDEILHNLTGQTQAQQDEAVARANLMETTANIRAAEAPGEIAKAKLTEEQLNKTLNDFPLLSNYDPVNMVQKMMRGGSYGPDFVEFMNLPGASQAFAHAQTIAEMQATRDQQQWMRMQMIAARHDDPEYKANISAARQLLVKSKVGTLDSWMAVISKPEDVIAVQNKLDAAKGNMSVLTQDEKNILASAKAQSDFQANDQQNENRKDALGLSKIVQEARIGLGKKPDQAGADLLLAPVNAMLTAASKKNGTEPYTAVYGQVPAVGQPIGGKSKGFHPFGGGPQGLFFIDKNGIRVEDNQAIGIGPQGLTNEALQALSALKGASPADRAKSLQTLKQKRPDIYNQVIGRLNP